MLKIMEITSLIRLVDRLRPADSDDAATATANVRRETARLATTPDEAAAIRGEILALLALPHQTGFYAEAGVRSALGFSLEIGLRLVHRLLPPPSDPARLGDWLPQVFRDADDHIWVTAVDDDDWLLLAAALGLKVGAGDTAMVVTANMAEAARVLSYRIAGAALDRELLRAEPPLEQHESPFLAQNAMLLPMLDLARDEGTLPSREEAAEVEVMLDQCYAVIDRVRRRAVDAGISVRLTYLLARLRQLIDRLRALLDLAVADDLLRQSVRLMKILIEAMQTGNRVFDFIGENVSLLARNVTDHASRHGEHYIAADRAEWLAMGRSAAGGGMVIAAMAMLKIQLSLLHLPPLTEGIVFGLNYGLGFVLIHLLGFTVATKQPAMTAAAIASTLEEARPRDLERLTDLASNVLRSQFIAVLGNVGVALPLACVLALMWPLLFGVAPAPDEKALHLLHEVDPLTSGSIFFAAVAGVGLFLSGLVSGYFDNQARYHDLAARLPRFGGYLDAHYGAILGNLFFGMFLGLVGAVSSLTGLPVDIRHVAFSSANLGTALTLLDFHVDGGLVLRAVIGVLLIALANLAVSFGLALYVAMKSRRQGAGQIFRLGVLLGKRLLAQPLFFMRPPA